jgi:hypothetical protein
MAIQEIFMSVKSVSAVLPGILFAGIGLSPVSAFASVIGLPAAGDPGVDYGRTSYRADLELLPASTHANMIILPAIGNPGNGFGPPDRVPPVNPPIDTPAFDNGLANTPTMMPASVPSHTLPGSGFGRTAVPVPATVWLFGSGLLGLICIARHKKAF